MVVGTWAEMLRLAALFLSSLLNEGPSVFFWYVFLGPLVKGSNRYQAVRAGFCHDISIRKSIPNTYHTTLLRRWTTAENVTDQHLEIEKLLNIQWRKMQKKGPCFMEEKRMKSFHLVYSGEREKKTLLNVAWWLSRLSPVARVRSVNKTPQWAAVWLLLVVVGLVSLTLSHNGLVIKEDLQQRSSSLVQGTTLDYTHLTAWKDISIFLQVTSL